MIERGQHFGLTLEARKPVRIARKRLWKNLNRDLPLQLCVGGPIDFPHAAGADGRDDFIRSEARACAQSHLSEALNKVQVGGIAVYVIDDRATVGRRKKRKTSGRVWICDPNRGQRVATAAVEIQARERYFGKLCRATADDDSMSIRRPRSRKIVVARSEYRARLAVVDRHHEGRPRRLFAEKPFAVRRYFQPRVRAYVWGRPPGDLSWRPAVHILDKRSYRIGTTLRQEQYALAVGKPPGRDIPKT